MEDIADALHHLCQIDGVLLGIATHLLLVHAEHAFKGEAPAHGLPQGGEHLHQVFSAVLQGLVAILVGTVVGDGRQELGHGTVAVAAVDGDHVKAQGLEILCLLAVVLDHVIQVFLCQGGDILLGTSVVLGMEVVVQIHAEILVLGRGVLAGHGGHAAHVGTVSGTAGSAWASRASRTARTSRAFRAGSGGIAHAHAWHHVHVGGTHDISAGLGAVEVDGIQKLAQIILGIGIGHVKEIEVGRRVVQHPLSGHAGHGLLKQVVDGHQCCAVPGTVCKMGDDLLRGILLGALEEVGRGG